MPFQGNSLTLLYDLLDRSSSTPVIRTIDAYSRHATRDSRAEAGRAMLLVNQRVPSQTMQA